MLRIILPPCLLISGSLAHAAPLAVRVVDSAGRPVSNAVIAVRPSPGAPAQAPRLGNGYAVSQKDLQFHPFVAVVPVGATVSFPNFDLIKHHVYSFAPAKRFELKLFAKDQSRSVRFDKPGVVPLGCNIHDSMSAFLFVTDTPFTAITDGWGLARLADAPAAGTLTVWHPYMRAPANQVEQQIGARAVKIGIRLRPPPMHSPSGY